MKHVAASLLIISAVAAGIWYTVSSLNEPPRGMTETRFSVPRGASAAEVGTLLQEKNCIQSGRFFALLDRLPGYGPLRAGTFRLTPDMTSSQIFKKCSSTDVETVTVTIPEGSNLYQMADILNEAGVCSREAFLALALKPETPGQFGFTAPNMEGYLFPDTYTFPGKTDVKAVLALMNKRLITVLKQNGIQYREAELHKLITLASLVEAEAAVKGEQRIISSVFHNRLKKNMRMDCDPTVRYAVKRFTGPIRKSDLESDSPYNTYRVRGLPPGPICSPGIHAILAAEKPAATDYLYFVSRNDRSHYFSTTYAEHDRAVQFYQRGTANGFIDRQQRYR